MAWIFKTNHDDYEFILKSSEDMRTGCIDQ